MEKFVELLKRTKDGGYAPRLVRLCDVVCVKASSFCDEHPVVFVKEGKRIKKIIAEEPYLLLKVRLGMK